MDTQKFRIVLSGKPRDGFDRDVVAESLSGLLRISLEQALGMLDGERSRIRKELEFEKAEQLLEKLVTRGVACAIEPVLAVQHASSDQSSDESGKDGEAGEAAPVELDLPETDVADDSAPPLPEVAAREEAKPTPGLTIVLESPPPLKKSKRDQEAEDAKNPGKFYEQPSSAGNGSEKKISGINAKRTQLLALAGVLLVAAGVWLVLPMLTEDESAVSAEKEVTAANVPPVKPEVANTLRRLDILKKSVKVWMIQFGSGFDPFQVTLDRLSQDLEVKAVDMSDGWGTAFRYEPYEDRYRLLSAGPDKQFGTGDDIHQETHFK